MIRAVLAVVLATALLAVTFPALDDARRDHTATAVESELRDVERAADDILASDDAVRGAGARRVVWFSVPAESWADAGVDSMTLEAADAGNGGVLAWTVSGGRRHEARIPDVPLATPDDEPVRFRSTGRHRLVLELGGTPDDPVVTVRRFKSDDGTTGGHARSDSRS